MRPGVSPAGTLESADMCTAVDAHTRITPRCGRMTLVVIDPEVTVPLVVMKAVPLVTWRAPTTWAWSRFEASMGTMASGSRSDAAGGGEVEGAWHWASMAAPTRPAIASILNGLTSGEKPMSADSVSAPCPIDFEPNSISRTSIALHFHEVANHLPAALGQHTLGVELDTLDR